MNPSNLLKGVKLQILTQTHTGGYICFPGEGISVNPRFSLPEGGEGACCSPGAGRQEPITLPLGGEINRNNVPL